MNYNLIYSFQIQYHTVKFDSPKRNHMMNVTRRYDAAKDQLGGAFAPESLSVVVQMGDGKTSTWRPGMASVGNLRGTYHSLDW